jgi:GT2 family glycosyltransferase
LTSIEKSDLKISENQELSIEVFVVDNNSSDGSIDFLEPIFPNVKFIRSPENLGFPKANNIAIRQSKGKYLLILNPDTILSENTLTKMYNFMLKNPNIGISGCKVLNADGSFQLACRRGFPTPWASFCKLFGLQALFSKSKLFAQYNQTFRPFDETYKIDAVIGAFMFCDTNLIKEIGGFDETYFMYGEDLDLCRQVQLRGRDVVYYHETSIIHFKGESTRRSSIDEIKHLYEAMEIFSRKYFSNSALFIFFLKLGITTRSVIARIIKNIIPVFLLLTDIFFVNISLMFGSYLKFGRFLGFADYAYPLVFFVTTFVFFISQFFNGEYFEKKISIPNTILSLTMTFFILSSLTYFFPAYRFSRGAVLVTAGATAILSTLTRLFIIIFERTLGKFSDKRIIIAGNDEKVDKMIESLQYFEPKNFHILGIVNTSGINNLEENNSLKNSFSNYQNLGNLKNINEIVKKNRAEEVIVTDINLPMSVITTLMFSSNHKVRYHIITEYDELVTSRIINEISGADIDNFKYNILKPRYKFVKRTSDIIFSFFSLTLFLPIILLNKNRKSLLKNWFKILIGKKTTIGIFPISEYQTDKSKAGLISLTHINQPEKLTSNSIINLNNYYLKNYTLSLDIDIIIKYFTRTRKK